MVRFDVIPVKSLALIALDCFLHSERAQIGTTPNKNIDEARGCGMRFETRSLALHGRVSLDNLLSLRKFSVNFAQECT